ncbi:Calcium-binding protein 8 [Channa argus]|uniref:Calcium-binding protein 8 n=1 Tax=Channa argus TaxID=215402 RepID=A0A6G1PTI8_CHAAH|nr:Calcium-binding protein 8 [Channa argus]
MRGLRRQPVAGEEMDDCCTPASFTCSCRQTVLSLSLGLTNEPSTLSPYVEECLHWRGVSEREREQRGERESEGGDPNCGSGRAQWFVDRQSAAAAGGTTASKSLMEEEVTEPDPQAVELTSTPPVGTHSEVNGDLPGNPYLSAGTVDVMESPAREPVVLQYPAEYTPSHHYGEKMPFHHVTAGLLYKGNYLSRSLSDSDSDVLASISVEELDGDGQVDFEEFMTILGPKLLSSETREGFLGSTIDTIFWQFDMQRITLEELKHILFYAFRDHLTMKDIENIIINEEESLKENSGNCQTEFEGVHPSKKNRQTCVRKSLICAFAMAFIISVMLIAANQMLRNGME